MRQQPSGTTMRSPIALDTHRSASLGPENESESEGEDEDELDEFLQAPHPDTAPPLLCDAETALEKIERILRPPRDSGPGYKPCKLDNLTRTRYEAIAMCLRFFLHSNTGFIDASGKAAIAAGRGLWHARVVRQWVQHYIKAGHLPRNNYGWWNLSALEDEDIAEEIKLHLQQKGKFICAEDIVRFLNDAEVRQRLNLKKSVSVRTGRRWLTRMGYRWRLEPKGQYFDGHEREDVVYYRQNVFVPRWKALEPFILSWDGDTGLALPFALPGGRRQVVVWYHDESTFYAHDRRRLRWVHVDEHATPFKKGDGVSVMVADFVSAEHGFLKSKDG